MAAGALTFLLATDSPQRVGRELGAALGRVTLPGGAMLFVSGRLADRVAELADQIASLRSGVPVLIAAGTGVLTEAGELEGQSAVAGLVYSGKPAEVVSVGGEDPEDVGDALGRTLADLLARSGHPALIMVSADVSAGLGALEDVRGLDAVFGAGTAGSSRPTVIDRSGVVRSAKGVVMVLHGVGRPLIAASPACRLLTPLLEVTESHGRLLLSLGGQPALEVLSRAAEALDDRSLVLVALGDAAASEDDPAVVLRPIQGVDPTRGAVVLGSAIDPDRPVAFAVRDADAARTDLTRVAHAARRGLAGALPRFGIYLSCSGRGSGLYGAPDVDTTVLKRALPELPFAGLLSAFEIAPHRARPELHLYTGVLSVFSSPS